MRSRNTRRSCDVENQYRAQDMVNGFAKQVVDDYVRKLHAYVRERESTLIARIQVASKIGDDQKVQATLARFRKLQSMAAARTRSAQDWQARIQNTSLRNPLKAVEDILKFNAKNGGMSEAQRGIAEEYRNKLAHQKGMTAQDMLRQLVAIKRLYAEMGAPKPEWLCEMIGRTQYAAEQEIQNKARRLQ